MRWLPVLLLAPLLSAGSAPPAPITYTIQPGDTLPKYDGDLDRVEVRAVPGSRVLTVWSYWPVDGLDYIEVRWREQGRFKLLAADVTMPWDGERWPIFIGPSWYRTERWIHDAGPISPPFTFPNGLVWPTPEWEDHHPSQWYHEFPTTVFTTTNGWEALVFEGTGEVALDWVEEYRFDPLYRPTQMREAPSSRVEADWSLQVTYYPR